MSGKGGEQLDRQIVSFVQNVALNYSCQSLINYYAKLAGLPNDVVRHSTTTSDGRTVGNFSSKVYSDVCGSITYSGGRPKEYSVDQWRRISGFFISAESEIDEEVGGLAYRFLPEGRNLPRPTRQNLVHIAARLQSKLMSAIREIESHESSGKASDCFSVLPSVKVADEQMLANYSVPHRAYRELKELIEAKVP